MSYDKPKVTQSFEILITARDRNKDGKLTDNALEFLRKVMPDTVHRIAPHVPPGKDINIYISIDGELV